MYIEKLTDEQESLLSVWADKWTKHSLSTEPVDLDVVTPIINDIYINGGLKPPDKIILCDSPLSGTGTLLALGNIGPYVWDNIASGWFNVAEDSVRSSFRSSVGDNVRDIVWKSIWESIADSVRGNIAENIWVSLRVEDVFNGRSNRNGWFNVGTNIWNNSAGGFVKANIGGSHRSEKSGYYDYFLTVLKLDCVEPMIPFIELSKHCGWWMPHENICIVQHRHNKLHLNDTGRLHNFNGMAFEYPDGWGGYYWHGVRIDKELATSKITSDMISNQDNMEIRQLMIEKMTP